MELMDGYKMTDVGIIPMDWEVSTLKDISIVKTGPFGSALHEKDYVLDGTPIITVEHLGEFGITTQNLPRVSDIDLKRLKTYSLKKGDLVFSRVGSVDRNSIISQNEDGWLFSGRLLRIRIKNEVTFPPYLNYYFRQEVFKDRVRKMAVGQTMPSLNTKILNAIEVALPSTLKEQKAIATALSEMDALLQSIDQLIAKKRAIKQGAMQQLLTPPSEGGKRLEEFRGEWEVKTLGEIGEFKNGINKGKKDFGFGSPFVNLMDVFGKSTINKEVKFGLVNSSSIERQQYELRRGDVLFIRSSVKPSGVGLTSLVYDNLENTVFSGFLIRFRPFDKLDFNYKVHCFYEEKFRQRVMDSSTISANTNINQEALKNLHLIFPPTKEEQKAIAKILSDMDREINSLEKQRAKYQQLKKGMMQELLTGKIRLI